VVDDAHRIAGRAAVMADFLGDLAFGGIDERLIVHGGTAREGPFPGMIADRAALHEQRPAVAADEHDTSAAFLGRRIPATPHRAVGLRVLDLHRLIAGAETLALGIDLRLIRRVVRAVGLLKISNRLVADRCCPSSGLILTTLGVLGLCHFFSKKLQQPAQA
jgi:hypothetical protein